MAPSGSTDWRDHAECRDADPELLFPIGNAHRRGKLSARSAGERTAGAIRDVLARPRPGQGDRPVTAVPFLDVPAAHRVWVLAAFLLGLIARDTLGDPDAAGRALQRALDLAEPDQVLFPRVIDPPPGHLEALSRSEIRVLRYLHTNLSAREIAGELYLSVNTVKTHQRHLYRKLGARTRTQAVEQARALGLLAPSSRRR
jgi:LuxR family transcriptional regulator, maltose regulon positive regulatory protein